MEEYITLTQLCQHLGIKKNTAYKLSSNNILPKFKPGGKVVLFKTSDVVKYIESKRIASNQELRDSVLKQLFKN